MNRFGLNGLVALGLALAMPAPAIAAYRTDGLTTTRCLQCGGTVDGGTLYKIYEAAGGRYPVHGNHPRPAICHHCASPLGAFAPWGRGRRNESGDLLCARCDTLAVRDLGQAQALLNAVRTQMASWGMPIGWGTIPLRFGEVAAMNGMARQTGYASEAQGLCSYQTQTRDGQTRLTSIDVIVRRGVPRSELEMTLAHELTHAWAAAAGAPETQEPALREGAANLVAYYYLQTVGTPEAAQQRHQMMLEKHPAYGEGMRRLMKYAAKHRVSGVLNVLRTSRTIPAGY